MDNRVAATNGYTSAASSYRESFPSITALKATLRRLTVLVADEEDCRIEVLDEISKTVTAMKDLTCNQHRAHTSCSSEKTDPIVVPEHFLCPISSELMADPVMLASGQTYDRAYIQQWLDADHMTCPRTQQILPHTALTPNFLVRTMIEQWCHSQGLQPPSPARSSNDAGGDIKPQEAKYVNILVDKVSGNCLVQQREAARELRVLTRKKPSHRNFLGKAESLGLLIPLLGSHDSETQEHVVTTMLNLSIHEQNKALIAEEGGIEQIVEVLRNGMTMAARENAAAALFSLSSLEENKVRIGSCGAIPALVQLLRDATSRGKKDAASALFSLCIYNENKSKCVRAGLVPLLVDFMTINGNNNKNEDEQAAMRDESLTILALVSSDGEGAKAIGDAGAVPLLLDVTTEETSPPRNKENAVGILVELCSRDSTYLKEVKKLGGSMALVELSLNGTSRARRKAKSLLDRMNRQQRLATI